MDQMQSRRRFLKYLTMACAGAAVGFSPVRALASERLGTGEVLATRTLPLMGTYVTISVVHSSRMLAEEAVGRAFERVALLVPRFNRFDPASPVSVLNDQGRLAGAPPELVEVLRASARMGDLSDGGFDITVKPVVDLLRGQANPEGELRVSADELRGALSLVDPRGVRLAGDAVLLERRGMGVTLDGIAKGHIVDEASRELSAMGAVNHLINAGGDIRASGRRPDGSPWVVAVQDPDGGDPLSVIRLDNAAVATSGSYEVYYDRRRVHHHLINPLTGLSAQALKSVSVRAATAMEADALATAVFVAPPEEGLGLAAMLPGTECLVLTHSGARRATPGWS